VRSVLLIAGAAALVVAGVILSLALSLSLAWDEVPPPPDPATRSAPPGAFAAFVTYPGGGLQSPLLVASTFEGRQT